MEVERLCEKLRSHLVKGSPLQAVCRCLCRRLDVMPDLPRALRIRPVRPTYSPSPLVYVQQTDGRYGPRVVTAEYSDHADQGEEEDTAG